MDGCMVGRERKSGEEEEDGWLLAVWFHHQSGVRDGYSKCKQD